jgi:hypothetical protein
LEIQFRAELRDSKQNACDAINSSSTISSEQVKVEQDEQREPTQQIQASPAFSFGNMFAAQPAASPALNSPDVGNSPVVHMGELADGVQVTASSPAASLVNSWAASPAVIPAIADNASAGAPDDIGSVLSSAQQGNPATAGNTNARAPNDNGSVISFGQQCARAPSDSDSHNDFAQQGSPAQYSCLVSFLKNGTMAASPLRARTPTLVPACSPPLPPANQSAQSQYHCISSTEPEQDPFGYTAQPVYMGKYKMHLVKWRKEDPLRAAEVRAAAKKVAKCLFSDFEEAGATATTTTITASPSPASTAAPPPPPPLAPQPGGGHILVIGRVVLTSSLSSPFHFRAAQYAA